ncbi:hypothetical protein [Cryptosporangium japonicum]|uniref:Methyltransferase n=1 Tax=Cryptosporangium japonicum TaxID=80872 RepID=A0ABN0V0W9_9ACTN
MGQDGYVGESVAAAYDDDPDSAEFSPAVVAATVDVLAELAGGGRALEFAVGTGRIAVPLAARGVEVAGIELSPAEFDLMAQLAGLHLEARWSDWHRAPFTQESTKHISTWQKPG